MKFKREKRHDESCRLPKTYYTVLLEHTLSDVLFFIRSISNTASAKNKKDIRMDVLFVVREAGVEPARPCEHWHLKPASLPIPPLARGLELRFVQRGIYNSIGEWECQGVFKKVFR